MNLRVTAESLFFTVRREPEFVALLALVIAGAVWATRTQTIPGPQFSLVGSGVVGLSWGCLYVGLGLAYCADAQQKWESLRTTWRKLGLCLLLGLTLTYLCTLLVPALLAPATWNKLFYLRRL
jgi:hypothetical protein